MKLSGETLILEMQSEKLSLTMKESHYKSHFLPISAYERTIAGNVFCNMFINNLSTWRKLSVETSMEEVKSVVLQTNELEPEEKHACENFVNFSQSSFH